MLKAILKETERDVLSRLVDGARRAVVVCHQNPDGDAVGSSAAMKLLLQRMGKEVTAIVPNPFPDMLRKVPVAGEMLLGDRQHQKIDRALERADLILMLDFNTPRRMGDVLKDRVMAAKGRKILIDHHLDPEVQGIDLVISHPEMCSTCEVLLRVMMDMGWTEGMTQQEASALYTGIMTDTGNFTYASSRPEIFVAVARLLQTGIDKDRIYRDIFFSHTEGRFRLLGYLLHEKMEVMEELHTALITMTNEERNRFKTKNGATEGFVNLPLEIEGMRLSIFLREDTEKKGLIRVSTRSVDDFPCNELCQEFFNGGGHKNASGGSLYMTMEEAVQVVHRAVLAYREKLMDNA